MIPVEASNYLIEQQFEHDDFDDDENEYDGPRGIGDFEDLFRSGERPFKTFYFWPVDNFFMVKLIFQFPNIEGAIHLG